MVFKSRCLAQSEGNTTMCFGVIRELMKVFENHRLLISAVLTSLSCVTVVLDTKT